MNKSGKSTQVYTTQMIRNLPVCSLGKKYWKKKSIASKYCRLKTSREVVNILHTQNAWKKWVKTYTRTFATIWYFVYMGLHSCWISTNKRSKQNKKKRRLSTKGTIFVAISATLSTTYNTQWKDGSYFWPNFFFFFTKFW